MLAVRTSALKIDAPVLEDGRVLVDAACAPARVTFPRDLPS